VDAPLEAAAVRAPRVPPRRWLIAAAIAAVALAGYLSLQTTHPADPLAGSFQPARYVAFGLQPGRVYTAVVPVSATTAERPVILAVGPVSDMGARFLRVAGLASSRAVTVWPGGPRAAAAQVSSVSALRPAHGLRFAPGSATFGTHVWLAVTFRLHGRGCIDLPSLRLRYAVGGATFTRDVRLPMRVRTAGNHAACSSEF
jgi:hypothetical protein